MSYSPRTHLVYFPRWNVVPVHCPTWQRTARTASVEHRCDFNAGSLPQDEAVEAAIKARLKGHLARLGSGRSSARSGACSTSTRGTAAWSRLRETSYSRATRWATSLPLSNGPARKLWSIATGTGILAPPVAPSRPAGEQYVAIEVGWGGAFGLAAGELARDVAHRERAARSLLSEAWTPRPRCPPVGKPATPARKLDPPPDRRDAPRTARAAGKAGVTTRTAAHSPRRLRRQHGNCCRTCAIHAVPARPRPRSRRSCARDALRPRGMVAFGAELSPDDVRADQRLRDPARARSRELDRAGSARREARARSEVAAPHACGPAVRARENYRRCAATTAVAAARVPLGRCGLPRQLGPSGHIRLDRRQGSGNQRRIVSKLGIIGTLPSGDLPDEQLLRIPSRPCLSCAERHGAATGLTQVAGAVRRQFSQRPLLMRAGSCSGADGSGDAPAPAKVARHDGASRGAARGDRRHRALPRGAVRATPIRDHRDQCRNSPRCARLPRRTRVAYAVPERVVPPRAGGARQRDDRLHPRHRPVRLRPGVRAGRRHPTSTTSTSPSCWARSST